MNKKFYFIVSGVIIVVLLVSAFAFLSNGNTDASSNSGLSGDDSVTDDTIYQNETGSPPPTTQTITPAPTINQDNTINYNTNLRNPLGIQIPSQPLGTVGNAQNITSAVWRTVATNAWQYYQPGVGIDSTTGIPRAVIGFPIITDWDLGVYVQAIIDAQKIGVLNKAETWGADDRIERVLTFLENRQLNSNDLPYQWYSSNGLPATDWMANQTGGGKFDITDAGRLLLSLSNLKTYNPALTERIDNVTKVKPDYSVMLPTIEEMKTDNGIYGYVLASGFAAFFPSVSDVPGAILNNIMASPSVNTYGVNLPQAPISGDPLFIALFSLQKPDQRVVDLSKNVYLAHEARYSSTRDAQPNSYVAFGEGNSGNGDVFIYEWVVGHSGRTWVVKDSKNQDYGAVTSNVYSKISFCFLSVYKTQYARNAVIFVENNMPQPQKGYCDGINNSDPTNLKLVDEVGTNTNGLIIGAARYAIDNGA